MAVANLKAAQVPPTLTTGRVVLHRVVSQDGETYSVATEEGDVMAKRAASCLLRPEAGDHVLLTETRDGAFILAVLERTEGLPARVGFPGDALVEASGNLRLEAGGDASLQGAREVEIRGERAAIRANETRLVTERLEAVAASAQAHWGQVSVVAGAVETVATRIMQRAKRFYRFVDDLDQLRARHIDYRADSTAQLKGENTVVTARQVVKIDGEQVHIG